MSSYKYAVVKAGGKQYTVEPGQKVTVDRMTGNVGDAVTLGEVLLVSAGEANVQVGTPLLNGAKVTAKIVAHPRGKKIVVFKKRIKTGFTKKKGHRQDQTQLLIESISA